MGNCCAYWTLASPFRNYPVLLRERCWSLRNSGRCRVEPRSSTRVARLPSPASSGSSSCVEEAQLSKTSTATQTDCFYRMKLIFGGVVEIPRILRCRAVQSDILQITVPKLLNSQAFWINLNTFILDNTFRLKKTFSWGKLQLWIKCMASTVYKINLHYAAQNSQTNRAHTTCLCSKLASRMLDRGIELIILPMMQICVHI